MNKKGFTLIELLAVIVILAIIALIATPIVLNIIKDSRESAGLRSAEMYLDAVEQAISIEKFNNTKFNPSICTVIEDGNLTCDETELEIEVNGEVPQKDSTIIFTEGKITDVTLNYSNNKTIVKNTEGSLMYGKIYNVYKNGDVVYFNVTEGKVCSESDYTETQSATGVKEGCMKFYAFNDNKYNDSVNLLLDHNTTAKTAWISINDYKSNGGKNIEQFTDGGACQYCQLCIMNEFGPITLLSQLWVDTSAWKGTEIPQNYSIDQSTVNSGAKYTIDYSTYKARIITVEEIALITKNINWDVTSEASEYYYFDTLTNIASTTCKIGDTSGCKYGWLYDRTYSSCTDYGCLNNSDQSTYGYWTVSPTAFGTSNAWRVGYSGSITTNTHSCGDSHYGVRPVIEVSKSNLD